MKIVYTLKYKKAGSWGAAMERLSEYFGLFFYMNMDNNNAMSFYLLEEIADDRTARFFGDVLCKLFDTYYYGQIYKEIDSVPENCKTISIYSILFGLIHYVKKLKNQGCSDKHFKEKVREEYECGNVKTFVNDFFPEMYLLKDGTYSLVPVEHVTYGYDCREIRALHLLKGKIQKTEGVRVKKNNEIRATYRNLKLEALSKNCHLYRLFEAGGVCRKEDLYFIARSMCATNNGEKKFLELLKKSKCCWDSEKYYSWERILFAIIKENLPIPKCEMCPFNKECNHAKNMIETAKIDRNDVKILRKDKYKDIETTYQELQDAFITAVDSDDNKIHLIIGQTALGKSRTYIEYMKKNERPLIIAVPTHRLKNEIIQDAKMYGVSNICGTPDIKTYGISDEILAEINVFYDEGAGKYALRQLKLMLGKLDKKSSDYDKITRFFDDCKISAKFEGHIVTTHAKLLHMSEETLNSHTVIIDEDILRSAIRTEKVPMKNLERIKQDRVLPYSISNRIRQLYRYKGFSNDCDDYDLEPDQEYDVIDKLLGYGTKIIDLLKSQFRYVDNDMVHFIVEDKLPDCKLIILSATASDELYRKFYPARDIEYYECSKVKYKGKVFQYTDSTYSRDKIENDKNMIKRIKNNHPDCELITFKKYEREFGTEYHFGNTEGLNCLKGKDIVVVGLPNTHDIVYCLYGMRAGASLKKAHMHPRKIEYNNKEFWLNTYKDDTLRLIQCWIISSQLEQAVGRARLLREKCTVYVYAGFPVEQAEFVNGSFKNYFSAD